MSSPLAKPSKSAADDALIAVHRRLSHSHRVNLLAQAVATRIERLFPYGSVRALDVGCGDMSLADAIAAHIPGLTYQCVDIHPCSDAQRAADSRWLKYRQFDGKILPFASKDFDVVTLCDVLHHVPKALRSGLLRSAGTVGRKVVIKDHFEYGAWSRQALRAMDFVGNFGYGVSIPNRYFTQASFARLCAGAGLKVIDCKVGIRLYDHLPIARRLLSPDWQFVATCESMGDDQSTGE